MVDVVTAQVTLLNRYEVRYDLLYRARVLRCMGILSDRMLHCSGDSCLSRGEAEMSVFKGKLPISPYPATYIPKDAKIILAVDEGSKEGDLGCEVKGFYLDGVFHIQEIVYHEPTRISR
jgi:hypothetical protein